MQSDIYFIVNPRAGSGKTMSEWVPAERRMEALGIPYETAMTDHKKHATELAYDAAEAGYRKIMAVGGDGSVHEVFTGIMRWCEDNDADPSEFYFGVVPIGSGNDWIKSLNVPHDTGKIISLIASSSYVPMDVIKVSASGMEPCYMANIAGVGFDSRVCARVNALKEGGYRNKMIYLNALRYTIMKAKAINVAVVADRETIYSGAVYSIAIGNGKYSGSGMIQVPMARYDDGMIDVTVIPKISFALIAKYIPKLFKGNLHEAKELVFARCRELSIVPLDAASHELVEVDGELEGQLPVRFTMTDRQINALSRGAVTSEAPSRELL